MSMDGNKMTAAALSQPQVAGLAKAALRSFHRANFLHGDIRLANLLYDGCNVKLTDLGMLEYSSDPADHQREQQQLCDLIAASCTSAQ